MSYSFLWSVRKNTTIKLHWYSFFSGLLIWLANFRTAVWKPIFYFETWIYAINEEQINIEAVKRAIFELQDQRKGFEELAEIIEVTKSTLHRYYKIWVKNVPDIQLKSSRDLHIAVTERGQKTIQSVV